MRIIYKCNPNWGWLVYLALFITYFLTIFYLIQIPILFKLPILIIIVIPLIVLNLILWPATKSFFTSDLIFYTKGIQIRKNFLSWNKIKSISFQSGRIGDKPFTGKKLPAVQKIFVLDKKGKEYSCIIDIDYWLKPNRKENNLRKIRELLYGSDKISLVSDWAEKK